MSNFHWLALLSLTITLLSYYLSKVFYRRFRLWYLSPILLTPVLIIGTIELLQIPLPTYFEYTHWLVALLAPATIAFALPIYRQRKLLRLYPLTLSVGVLAGMVLGLGSSLALSWLAQLPPSLSHSMLLRSVSTPFALAATGSFNGIPELTTLLVLLTGMIGMLLGEPLFRLARVRTDIGKGLALGSSSHGAGTAKASELGSLAGVVASLAMIFSGIVMVLASPLLGPALT